MCVCVCVCVKCRLDNLNSKPVAVGAQPWLEHVERKKRDNAEHGRKGKQMNKVRGREQE